MMKKDFFITKNGQTYAGTHIIADFWGCKNINCSKTMTLAFTEAVKAAKATLLHIHAHTFEPNGGISAVAVLAESHISTHTWPETGYAAFDVFMCGESDPMQAIQVLKQYFEPETVEIQEIHRGIHKKLLTNAA